MSNSIQDQIDKARKDLFGVTGEPPTLAQASIMNYHLPAGKTIPCHENQHGEWVPDGDVVNLEEK